MKVAMVTPFPDGDLKIKGGVAGVSYYLSCSMVALFPELDLHVIVPSYCGRQSVDVVNGISVHYVPMPNYLPPALANISVFRSRLFKCLSTLNPDLVHFQGAASWGYRYKGRKIITIHGIPEKDVLFQSGSWTRLKSQVLAVLEGMSRKDFRNSIIINEYVNDSIGSQLVGNKFLIANPIDEGCFHIAGRQNRQVVLFGGVICQRKNVLGVLSAFCKVANAVPEAELWIAGNTSDPDYYEACLSFVAEHKLTQKVRFLGSLGIDQMREALGAASVLVLLSYQETAPLIIAEAMAGGIPVVASNICGIPYMIDQGINGFTVDPNDTDSAANYLISILRDPFLATRLGIEAKRYAECTHHPVTVAQKTMDAFKAVLDEGCGK